jgi:flagellar biogenesis protein FliO
MNQAQSGRRETPESVFSGLSSFLLRWMRGQHRRPRQLRLCETLALGEKKFLAVVEFKHQRFLVGGTSATLSLLAELPGSDAGDKNP